MSAGPGHAAGAPALRPAAARGRWHRDGIEATEAFSRGGDIDCDWMGWGVLRVLSRQSWAPGAARDDGRVANMERLVLVLDGVLDVDCGDLGRHRLEAGGMVWMGSGHGMASRLANASATASLQILECWLQPDRVNAAPALEVRAGGFPGVSEAVARESSADADAWITLAAAAGAGDSLPLRQRARIMGAGVDAGAILALPAGSAGRCWLEVLDGGVIVDGVQLAAGDGLGWPVQGAGTPVALVGAAPTTARVLLFQLPA
ncbi:pirin family protein [Luteimonas sp. A649]